MNRKIAFFCVVLFWQGAAVAVNHAVETGMDELSDELQLTADQKSRLDQIFNDKHEKYRIIREETQSKIRALLSDEQLEKWNTLKRHSFDR